MYTSARRLVDPRLPHVLPFGSRQASLAPAIRRSQRMSVPPGVSERDFERAARPFQVGRRSRLGVHERRGRRALPRRLLAALERARGEGRVGRRRPGIGGAGSRNRPYRQRVPRSSLPDLYGPQPGLRRLGARVVGQCRARPEAHEPDPRGRRAQRLCARRARRQLLRSLPPYRGAGTQALDRLSRSRLGQHRRQRARSRRRLHDEPVPRPLGRPVRPRGRDRRRRARAHGHGRACRGREPGSSSSTATARTSTACSRSRTSAS